MRRPCPRRPKIIGKAAGRKIEFVPTPIEEVRKFSEDFAIMLEWFDAVGYNVDIKAVAKESGIRPTTLRRMGRQSRLVVTIPMRSSPDHA